MLTVLRIHNLALIEDAELEFTNGLNVLTGETSAGKSFIIRAIDFLTGERIGVTMVRPGKNKAVVEALFTRPGYNLILRRELSAETGRSRIFLNDQLSSKKAILELRPQLVLHTSQHCQQKLLQSAYQAKILDKFLPDSNLLAKREKLLNELQTIVERRRELEKYTTELSNQREFLEYQKDEINRVNPQFGEEEELLIKKKAAQSRGRITKALVEAQNILNDNSELSKQLLVLARDIETVSTLLPEFENDQQALEEFRLQLQVLQNRLRRAKVQDGDINLDKLEARLFELSRLKRKLNKNLEQILSLQDEIIENLSFLNSCHLDLKRLDEKKTKAADRLKTVLNELNQARREAGNKLCCALESELHNLGFSEYTSVTFSFAQNELYPGLMEERAQLLWIPNPGQPPYPLSKIASGGELSRFLLALASLKSSDDLPTLIFDEIDTGIGGHTLIKVGERLKALSKRQQVLLVTHWAQLAKMADRHFKVNKDVDNEVTYIRCRQLAGLKIKNELKRMSGW